MADKPLERATSPRDYGVTDAVDIGHDIQISAWENADGTQLGVNVWHDCAYNYGPAGVAFDSDAARDLWPRGVFWKLESRDPLTISPSIHCLNCGLHGFVRDGRWVPA